MKICSRASLIPAKDYDECFGRLVDLGFEAVELMGSETIANQAEISKTLKKHKILFQTVCGVTRGCLLSEKLDEREQAILIHVFFTLTIFTLTNAYREWAREQDEEELIDKETPSLGIKWLATRDKKEGKKQGGSFYQRFLWDILT